MVSLIATTRKDSSLPYLYGDGVQVAYFDDPLSTFRTVVSGSRFDVVYLRDPFNTGSYDLDDVKRRIRLVSEEQPDAYYIDRVASLDGVLIEDKWRQYQLLAAWMPRTMLGGERLAADYGTVAKRRISSRSKHVAFDVPSEELTEDWVVQERLFITEELRVYYMFGDILETAGRRQSKSPGTRTKLIGLRQLTAEEENFCYDICRSLPEIDFAGLDIAITPSGLRLLEINRSPQFGAYNVRTGRNIADNFWQRAREMRGA